MSRGGLARGLALIASGAALACATPVPRVDFSEGPRTAGLANYDGELATWTRHAKVVKDVGTVIEVWAVYKSSEFRQAYIERYASVYHLSDNEKRSLYTAQMDASRRAYEFHVTAQTTNYKWNDLERDSSPWRITLIDGTGAQLVPKRIEVLKLPELYESQFFPNYTEFSRTFLIRFDRAEADAAGFAGPGSGSITLRIASPLAEAELAWQSR